jgi:hypothetical protein
MTVWLPTAPLTAAERKRRQRRRQECGSIVVPVEVDEIRVTEALLSETLLQKSHAEDRQKIGAALAIVIAAWLDRTGRKNT